MINLNARYQKHILRCGVVLVTLGFLVVEASGRKESTLQDVPASVTALSAEDMGSSSLKLSQEIRGLIYRTPGITTDYGDRNVDVRIRGDLTQDRDSTLVFVNGRRVSTSIEEINPDDIESVNVIKGESATAIYGSAAVGGVVNIIIKTPKEEGVGSFIDPESSPFKGDPYQAGYRAMATAKNDPIGQALSSFYDSGGKSGADAGFMYAGAFKIRYTMGGTLCDMAGGIGGLGWYGTDQEVQDAGKCVVDEMMSYQIKHDTMLGITPTGKQIGDYLYTGLNYLGFNQRQTNDIITRSFGEQRDWGVSANFKFKAEWDESRITVNPGLFHHFLNYKPDGKYGLPAWDDDPWSLDLSFGEENYLRDPQESFQPNDPYYKKPDSAARKVGGFVKKGFGSLLGGIGIGISSRDEESVSEDQWGLHDVGYTPMGTGKSAWDIAAGSKKNIIVAVIDSGLDTNHPDRPRHIWRNVNEIPNNNIDDDTNGYVDDIVGWNFVSESSDIDDDYGHGTFVTGIIAANSDNGEGIAGINPGAQIMTLKVSNDEGVANSLAIYRALRYAVDNGARIINISLGREGLSRLEQVGINYAYAMGCMVVVAAGNQNGDIANYGPPGARRTFSVTSMNIDGSRRSLSNSGMMVALSAPGESIYSLTARKGKLGDKILSIIAGKYHRMDGTSFAAPFVAGTASLILANKPYLSNHQVEDMILSGADDVGESGWDMKTGMGKLNAYNALSIEPESAFAPRITDWKVNQDGRGKIVSVDIYGVIRGPVDSYEIGVGKGREASRWEQAFGPKKRLVQHGHIARLPGRYFQKGTLWTVQLRVTALDGENTVQNVVVQRDD